MNSLKYRKNQIIRIKFGFWLNLKLGRTKVTRENSTCINVTKIVVTSLATFITFSLLLMCQRYKKVQQILMRHFPIIHWASNYRKNAAKRSRQHAGKKYREYAQRRVCFVNKQVPCSTPI